MLTPGVGCADGSEQLAVVRVWVDLASAERCRLPSLRHGAEGAKKVPRTSKEPHPRLCPGAFSLVTRVLQRHRGDFHCQEEEVCLQGEPQKGQSQHYAGSLLVPSLLWERGCRTWSQSSQWLSLTLCLCRFPNSRCTKGSWLGLLVPAVVA